MQIKRCQADIVVSGSDQFRQETDQSASPLFFFCRLYVDAGVAASWIAGHTNGKSPMQYDPAETSQNRSPDKDHGSQSVGITCRGLSVYRALPSGLPKPSGSSPSLLKRETVTRSEIGLMWKYA